MFLHNLSGNFRYFFSQRQFIHLAKIKSGREPTETVLRTAGNDYHTLNHGDIQAFGRLNVGFFVLSPVALDNLASED